MWFEVFDTVQGKLILIALFIVVAAIFQNRIVNSHIERINESNKDDCRKPIIPSAYYYSLIIAAVLLVAAIVLPFSNW